MRFVWQTEKMVECNVLPWMETTQEPFSHRSSGAEFSVWPTQKQKVAFEQVWIVKVCKSFNIFNEHELAVWQLSKFYEFDKYNKICPYHSKLRQ